jgi:hypothetical protein
MARITLTNSAQSQVNRLRRSYENLIGQGYTQQNAYARVVAEHGHASYDLICLATGRAYVDYDTLRAQGLLKA